MSQLSPEKGRAAWRKILDRIAEPKNYFPIQIISYETGAAILACLQKWGDMDWEGFSDQPFAYEMFANVPGGESLAPEDFQIAQALGHIWRKPTA